ncbi:MucBP domain-containing protein [Enterococcus termitis]|uniref:MucBP domain-containing protein n=1 Tax=Enterococcus termitis TaxID=332950 RepID=A0A1E5GCX2_9ENTE|nr:MucBP domain-containing protein [Enterococcus termitis]OEG10563.1 hypothetical protein BCR25_08825 [Enterococcus termitis]OJG97815.1 hypothetical protein RV18_GL003829 [Enterococcus termitis]
MNHLKKVLFPSVLCLCLYIFENDPTEVTAIDLTTEDLSVAEQTTSTSSESTSSFQASTLTSDLTQPALKQALVPDNILKETILNKLGKPLTSELTKQDLAMLTTLELTSAQINSLAGLEYAVNLTDIRVEANNVTDFRPLEQLSSLVYVRLRGQNLTSANFPDLKKSTGITYISASATQLTNDVLPKLTQLSELQRLYLDSNMGITTIEPLKVLPKLRSISIQFCGVTDFTVINDFPVLNDLAAFGQNIGRMEPSATITRSTLAYDTEQETVFVPFELMPHRLTNFDGYLPPFSTSSSANETVLEFNGVQLPENRLQITDQGITVLNVSTDEFASWTSMHYNARINNPAGSYATPAHFGFYSISSGTYLQDFTIVEDPVPGAPVSVHFRDTTGHDIIEPLVLTGQVGESFTAAAKTFTDWLLVSSPATTAGLFTETPQELTFIYDKALGADVMVVYTDEENRTLAEPDTLSGRLGTPYQAKPKQITDWQLIQQLGNTQGVFTKQPQTVRFIYKKAEQAATPSVIEPYTETSSSYVLPEPSTSRGLMSVGERHMINQIIPEQTTVLNRLPDTLAEERLLPDTRAGFSEPKTVSTKNPPQKAQDTDAFGSVTVKIVDEKGNEIAKPQTLTGKIGEVYTVKAKKNRGIK